MLDKKALKKKLFDGQVCLGTWIFLPCPDIIEVIGLAGLDFVVIDMEHCPITFIEMSQMIVAAESKDITPLVRVSELNNSDMLRAMDSGAHGVHLPHIDNLEECKQVVHSVKYKPLGERGMAPSTRAGGYTLKVDENFLSKANDDTLIVASLESKISITQNLDAIIEAPNIDVIYIGPYDLSQSLGYPGEVENPIVMKEMERVFSLIRKKGKIAGSFAQSVKRAHQLKDMGVNYLTCETDGTMLRRAFETLKEDIFK